MFGLFKEKTYKWQGNVLSHYLNSHGSFKEFFTCMTCIVPDIYVSGFSGHFKIQSESVSQS